jgi:hypothetical protein
MSAIKTINEYAKTINFTIIENSFDSKKRRITVICPENHTKNVNYKNWKTNVNKCSDCPKKFTNKEKITMEYLKQLFLDRGFELLDEEYKDREKIQYKCKCGHINSATLGNFRKMTHACNMCAKEIIGKQLLLPFDEVTKLFDDRGYKILITENEYTGIAMSIAFKCDNGHLNDISVAVLKMGCGCSICAGNKKLTYEFVKSKFEEFGYTMITENYVNARTRMEVKCKNNHLVSICYDDLTHSHIESNGCNYCAGLVRHKYDDVKQSFEDEKYTLLSTDYINAHKHLDFICPKGHKHYISYTHFVSGKRCGVCCESKGEMSIRKYLTNLNLSHMSEKRFGDCIDKVKLPFDFFVNNHFLIEYDGIQHFEYEEDDFFGGKSTFEKRHHHDLIKTAYCCNKKIPLLRISYKEFKNIPKIIDQFIEDLKEDPTLIHFSNDKLYEHLL